MGGQRRGIVGEAERCQGESERWEGDARELVVGCGEAEGENHGSGTESLIERGRTSDGGRVVMIFERKEIKGCGLRRFAKRSVRFGRGVKQRANAEKKYGWTGEEKK